MPATRQAAPAAPEAAAEPVPDAAEDAFSWRDSSWRERWRRIYHRPVARFAAFGALGLAVDVTILMILRRYTPLPLQAAVITAFAATYLMNFFLNRRFAFHAGHGVSRQLTKFIPQVTADYLLTALGVGFLTGLGLPTLPARVLTASTNAVLNYLAYRFWTFRPSRRQRQAGAEDEADAAD